MFPIPKPFEEWPTAAPFEPPQPPPQPPAPANDPLGNAPLNELLGPPPEPKPQLTPVAYRPEQLRGMAPRAAEFYKALDAKYPNDITLTSGYRSPTHNARVGGARGSQHMSGRAFDINVNPRWRTKELTNFTADARNLAQKHGLPLSGGYYGLNPRNGHAMHFDIRPGGGAMWGPNRSSSSAPSWLRAALTGEVSPTSEPAVAQLPKGPQASSPAGGARAASEYPGPQQVTDDKVVRHRPEWAEQPSGGYGVAGAGGVDQELAAAMAYDAWLMDQQRQQRLQDAFSKLGASISSTMGQRPSNVSTSGMRTAANAQAPNAQAFHANLVGNRGQRMPSELLAALQRRALFS